ncbi:uncharacterized protein LOC110733628 [Chenopodium quinoa]|uniref:uncharacterized protein LOC110733628 n=1 Tax=Chenopodium quinoa TaxID=63459 RepID=UPI000B7731EE|nr:uncharacterized protein LOC110733628 [Chenopodium quinoa]
MGSEYSSRKHLYDISKSKRTRRATLYLSTVEEDVVAPNFSRGPDQKNESDQTQTSEGQKNDHVKLKQLISVDGKADDTSDGKDKGRAILGQYFADEKQLQLVVKQPDDGRQGVKLKKFVKRYVKALSQMVKSKRNQRLENPAIRLSM